MSARYVQLGKSIDYTPTEDVSAGAIINLGGGLIGIAKLDIPANTLGSLAVEGVYDITKVVATDFSVGDKVYYDFTEKTATDDSTKTAIGVAILDAAGDSETDAGDGDETVRIVKINESNASIPQGVAVDDADAITAVNPTWGDTTSVDQSSNLDTFGAAVVADLTEMQTQLNAVLASLRDAGFIAE